MPIEILMPALSPTMKEGNLAKWIKKEGDTVKSGDVLAEIETDKATMEVEAVDEGVIGKILIQDGTENVLVNTPIAVLLLEGEDKSSLKDYKASSPDVAQVGNNGKSAQNSQPKEDSTSSAQKNATENSSDSKYDRKFISPLAKRIAEQNNIDIAKISGTGPYNRIVKDDVTNYSNSSDKSTYTSGSGLVSHSYGRNPEEYRLVKNNNIRKVIAKRLQESKQNVPHFYLSIDCNLDKLLALREEVNKSAPHNENGKPVYKISVNDLIIKASAMSLRDVPEVNSSWEGDHVKIYNNIDISVAVAIDDGLITPIVKNADQKTITAISNEMKHLAKKARDGKLQPEEFQGGGFSISNLGMYGIKSFSAIINPPQSAILAVGTSEQKLVLNADGDVEQINVMNLTLSSDHRIVDGAVGAKFLSKLKKYIESPYLMFV